MYPHGTEVLLLLLSVCVTLALFLTLCQFSPRDTFLLLFQFPLDSDYLFGETRAPSVGGEVEVRCQTNLVMSSLAPVESPQSFCFFLLTFELTYT